MPGCLIWIGLGTGVGGLLTPLGLVVLRLGGASSLIWVFGLWTLLVVLALAAALLQLRQRKQRLPPVPGSDRSKAR